jgi:aspartate racemase
MKLLGIIGGIAPESTIEYYRLLTAGGVRSMIINSIDLDLMLSLVAARVSPSGSEGPGGAGGARSEPTGAALPPRPLAPARGDMLVEYLSAEIARLERAGAEVALLASNTPHLVFDELRRRASIPMISIVESACDEAVARGLKRLALFGTRFTMQGRVYPDTFRAAGIELVVPEDYAFIHEKYMGELVKAVFLPETREQILAIIDTMKERDAIDGVILAGTELPLLLRAESYNGLPLLDTTRIHVSAAIRAIRETA